MLQSMRKSSASIFIYLIFGVLIVVFVLNFGPQANSTGGGCNNDTANAALVVNGTEITRSGFAIPYQIATGPAASRKAQVFEWLIRREILAQEGESRGLRVTDGAVDEEIKRGSLFFDGRRENIKKSLFDEVDGQFFFSYPKFQALVERNWQVSMNSFKDAQKREMLAAMTADLIRNGVQVSRDEALQQFLYENNTVTFDTVKFQPALYRAAMKLTEADVTRFVAGHQAEIQAAFTADERLYKAVKPQISVRQIFVAKPVVVTPPATPSAAGSDAAPSAPMPAATEDVKNVAFEAIVTKLTALRSDIAAGRVSFAEAAKTQSADEATKYMGGSVGWRTKDSPQLGETELNDAVKSLKAGEVSAVIKTARGAYLLVVDAEREGDLTFDQVKNELAVELAKDTWSKEAAKRAAIAALALAKAELAKPADDKGQKGKNLDGLYEREQMSPDIDLQRILNDPNLPDDQKQRLLQEYLKMRQPTVKTGSITVESRDVQAGWMTSQAGAGSANGSATGSATGAAATSPTTAAPTTTTPAAAPPVVVAAVNPLAPSADVLPAFGPITKASVTRLGPVARSNRLVDFGEAKALVGLLFDTLAPNELADGIFEAQGSYAIVQLIARTEPDMKEFDKKVDSMMQLIKQRRSGDALMGWLKDRCETLYKAGKIKPSQSLLREVDDQGKPLPATYKPCISYGSDDAAFE